MLTYSFLREVEHIPTVISEIVIILAVSCYNTAVTTERLPADYQAFLQSIKTWVQQA
jgi:hypothetical protein